MISKKKKKKKRSSPKFRAIFLPKFRKFKRLRGALFVWGGLFSIFYRISASKAQKTCDFAYFTTQWGGLEPPPAPPLATLLVSWIKLNTHRGLQHLANSQKEECNKSKVQACKSRLIQNTNTVHEHCF